MKYLLDTHVLLWHYDDFGVLPQRILEIIENPENELYVSSVSIWEIAIKKSLNKLEIDLTIDELYELLNSGPINLINIENKHLNVCSSLSFIHRDPFDRYLISTAISENLTLITHDKDIQKYDIDWIW